MNIRHLEKRLINDFEKLFCHYFAELDCEDDPLPLSMDCIDDCVAGLLSVAVAEENGACAGFIIYQIDDVINDWCFIEGAGDVRELFVMPEYRGRGIASALIGFAQSHLKEQGADTVYTLPTEESEKFFEKVGFSDCGDYCPELDNKVFTKKL